MHLPSTCLAFAGRFMPARTRASAATHGLHARRRPEGGCGDSWNEPLRLIHHDATVKSAHAARKGRHAVLKTKYRPLKSVSVFFFFHNFPRNTLCLNRLGGRSDTSPELEARLHSQERLGL